MLMRFLRTVSPNRNPYRRLLLKKVHTYSIYAMMLALCGLLVSAAAGQTHHHGAHVHGIAQLNIAAEGNDLHMEFISPAANLVGFEHAPRTAKEEAAIEAATAKLKNGETLFILPSESECRLVDADLATDIRATDHPKTEHAHHETAAQDDAEHNNETAHGHAKHDDDGHRHKNEAAHDHGKEGQPHRDFVVHYHIMCQHPPEQFRMDVELFRHFQGIEEIEVQLITETGQTALELSPQKAEILF